MNSMLLLVAIVVLVICGAGLFVLVRRHRAGVANHERRSAARAATGTTIIEARTEDRDGATVASVAEPRAPWYVRTGRRLGWRNGLLVAAALLLTLMALGFWAGLGGRSPDRFVVIVAPFDDGGDGRAGRNVAAGLAQALQAQLGGAIDVGVTAGRPASPEQALIMAADSGADLLIWGVVEPGAVLDSPSLSPRLIYTPLGAYGPNGWDGYLGRFAMPRSYALAREPLNGQAVLVPLIVALHDYARGAPDSAYEQIVRLVEDYPSLAAPLPRALLGNILWARGFYPDAAEQYRLALAEPADEQALLANNLGAILLDAGDPAALDAFQEAVRLLDGRDLGELRYNLAVLALREGRNADAVSGLEQARNLVPPTTPLLLDLARAYRESGRLDAAAAALDEAEGLSRAAVDLAPPEYRPMARDRYSAILGEQRALLDLARQIGAQGELLWELEIAAPLPVSALTELRGRLDAAADSSELQISNWRKRAASDSAAMRGNGLVSTGQAERAELLADRQRFYQAVIETELARIRGTRPPSAWDALFGTGRAARGDLEALETLQRRYADSAQIGYAIGRAQLFRGDLDLADASFDGTVRLAPQAPEGYFGRGSVARARGDRQRALELFAQALERNPRFFPAHYARAAIDVELGDHASAVAERRTIYELRPSASSAVALAQSLRLSGPTGYAEAEQVLMPLSSGSAEAAIELARLYNDAGRSDAALAVYRDALRLDPNSAPAAFELGETYAALGNYEQAERYLTQAVRIDPSNVDARLALADLYQGPLDDPRRADREYRQALDAGVDDPERLEQIGDAALASGNYRQAIEAYGDALAINSGSAALHHKLAQATFGDGQLERAAEQARATLELTDDPALSAAALIVLGDTARLSGDLPAASASYDQALQQSPGLIPAQIGLGLVAVGQGNWSVASGYFQQAATLPGADDDPLAQFWLGESLLRQGNYTRAIGAYNRALELQATFPAAYLGLAQAQHAQGGPDATRTALETVRAGLRQQPTYAEALLFQGKLLQELGRPGEAEAAYSASISANGRIAEAYYRRGIVEVQAGRYDDAVRDFLQAIELQPNFPEASYWLGRSYYAQGRAEPALQAFQQAVALNGTYTEALFYVGLASEDLGRTAEAISAYQTVITLEPNSELASRARVQIDRLT